MMAQVQTGMDAYIVTLDQHLTPKFRKMGDLPLFRFAEGDNLRIVDLDDGDYKSARIIAKYHWRERKWQQQVKQNRLAVAIGVGVTILIGLIGLAG